jgi:hypothetical protein
VVVFVKRQLHIGFAKLNLFPAGSGACMESAGIEFQRKQALVQGDLHLVDQGRVAPGKESILIGIVFSILAEVAAPDEAFDR